MQRFYFSLFFLTGMLCLCMQKHTQYNAIQKLLEDWVHHMLQHNRVVVIHRVTQLNPADTPYQLRFSHFPAGYIIICKYLVSNIDVSKWTFPEGWLVLRLLLLIRHTYSVHFWHSEGKFLPESCLCNELQMSCKKFWWHFKIGIFKHAVILTEECRVRKLDEHP